jgi:hypothetical protein
MVTSDAQAHRITLYKQHEWSISESPRPAMNSQMEIALTLEEPAIEDIVRTLYHRSG